MLCHTRHENANGLHNKQQSITYRLLLTFVQFHPYSTIHYKRDKNLGLNVYHFHFYQCATFRNVILMHTTNQ